ncbi:MAG: cation:dicarboxylase symporter family transporter [Spirochaetales bacterium]|nr:cation:dicarboxylase symporter family transporter [Spirochaetales bacterium]
MKTWFSGLLAAIIGFTAAVLFGNSGQFDIIVGNACSILLNIGTFILIPLTFVTLFAATASLRQEKGLIGPVYLVGSAWSIFTSLALSLLAGLAFRYFPCDFPMTASGSYTTSASLADVFSSNLSDAAAYYNPLSNTPLQNLLISQDFLLPAAFTAFVFGFAMKPDHDAIKPAYAVTNSFSEVMFRLSRLMSNLCWVFILFFSAYWFKEVLASGLLDIPNFLITIGIAVAVAVGAVIPLLYCIFTGFKGNPYRLVFRTISQAGLGLFSGNMLLSLTGNYHLCRRNNGVQKRVVSTTLPFGTFFTRGGTAMISTICLCALCTRAHLDVLNFGTIAMIAGVCTLTSMASALNLGYETIFVTVIGARMMGIDLGGLEVLMIAVLPIVNGAGVLIDMVLCSLGTNVAGRAIEAVVPVSFKETL